MRFCAALRAVLIVQIDLTVHCELRSGPRASPGPSSLQHQPSLLTCAALIATGKTEQMDFHFPNAIKNGVTAEELVEMITHLAFYVGWPSAMSAITRAKALLAPKDIKS